MKTYPKESKQCEVCGITYPRGYNTSRSVFEKSKFCSKKCFGVAQGIKNRTLDGRDCLKCGVAFRPAGFGSKYCSSLCAKHRFENRRGEKHQSWKGGRVHHGGYVLVRVWPTDEIIGGMVGKKDYVMEHRVVMAQMIGRPLEKWETVHHKNGIRNDNRCENLELRIGQHGKGSTVHCPSCTCNEEKTVMITTEYLADFNFN